MNFRLDWACFNKLDVTSDDRSKAKRKKYARDMLWWYRTCFVLGRCLFWNCFYGSLTTRTKNWWRTTFIQCKHSFVYVQIQKILFFFSIFFNIFELNVCFAGCDGNPTEVASRDKRALSLDLDKQPLPPKRSSHRSSMYTHINSKIMVVWLENFEDHLNLPICEQLFDLNELFSHRNVFIIYLYIF